MSNLSPVKVLHLIDGLAGGGCEHSLWGIVRLSDSEKFEHRIVTVYSDPGNYVYADRLRALGAYHQSKSPRILRFLWRNIQDLAARDRLIAVRKCLTLTWRIGSYGLASLELLKSIKRFRPDVVHAHGYDGLVAGLVVRGLIRQPLIHSVASLFSQMKDARFGWMPKLYARRHACVDRFFTGVSYKELISVGIPASKISFIPTSTDFDAADAVTKKRHRHFLEIRHSLNLSEDACVALSAGRLHSSKGHCFALEALPSLISKFPQLHWVVLGEGLERAGLEQRAKELGVSEHVHLIGFRPEPLPYYAAANIYLRTQVFEAENGLSYLAMAMGLPVVGFDTGGENELIDNVGHGILVPNRDSSALAKGITRLLMLPDRGRAMGELGAQYCQSNDDFRQGLSTIFSAYATLGARS